MSFASDRILRTLEPPTLEYKPTIDTPDDHFDDSALDAKWTVVAGSSGTVTLISTTNQAIYDLTTEPETLLTQVGRNGSQSVSLRQDYTLPDGASILTSFDFGATTVATDDVNFALLSVNSDDAGPFNGTNGQKLQVYLTQAGTGGSGLRIFAFDGTTANSISAAWVLSPIILRIARSSTTYYALASLTGGRSWISIGNGYSLGGAKDNFWIGHRNAASYTTGLVPITRWNWVRQGTNDLTPW